MHLFSTLNTHGAKTIIHDGLPSDIGYGATRRVQSGEHVELPISNENAAARVRVSNAVADGRNIDRRYYNTLAPS